MRNILVVRRDSARDVLLAGPAIRAVAASTGDQVLTMAGGVALNCVANSRILREGPFDQVWVQ